jgi:hypothetical protein
VPFFEAKERIEFMLRMMREFHQLCLKSPELKNVEWVDIDLMDGAYLSDPDHVLNNLAIHSTGTTPR